LAITWGMTQVNVMQSPLNDTHSKTIGYLLWIFGFTGAHRFYYGKPISGIIWFCTLGLLGIGWLFIQTIQTLSLLVQHLLGEI
jgi:TM2 domain-containing membrane protein YozV